ncbi:MAG: response regulator transcription factor [Anaerolineae bacterium]|nr:response regulator transcription factor [Anaerolineae bacterium]MDQ7035443.1 response regulator transcription factor [Anaerolineae bacterium]
MSETIRIIVADDHPVVRDGLVAILSTQSDFDIVAQADNGDDLIMKARQHQPSVIVTDLEMPGTDGVAAIRTLHKEHPQIAFIAFTAFDTDERILGAVQAGAKGYILKGAPRDDIFKAIRVVSKGDSLLEPTVATKLLQHMSGESNSSQGGLLEPLTEREMEVLQLLGTGKTNKAIGADLFITERTVKFYVSAILGKLSASNRTEAVTIAIQRGIISLP